MNAKSKGTRREHQARDLLLKEGYLVQRAGASLGAFDLIALPSAPKRGEDAALYARLVQVKSNGWAKPSERAEMEKVMNGLARVLVPIAEIWRYDDHQGLRVLRLETDWSLLDATGKPCKTVFERM